MVAGVVAMSDNLTYEDVPEPGGSVAQVQAAAQPGVVQPVAGDVMSNRQASIASQSQEKLIVSPINGMAIVASPDTAARARAGKAAKRERYRQMAEDGMLTAVQAVVAGVFTHEQAWGRIIAGQAELANSPDLRGSTQAAALVGKAIGALASEKVAEQPHTDNDLAELVAAWRQAKLEHPELGQRAAGLVRGSDDGDDGA